MDRATRFEKLLEPGCIGSVKTRNRIIKTGAGLLMWHEDDVHMRVEVKAFYERLAAGGVGLLIVEAPGIDYPQGVRYRNRYRMDDDKYIEGMAELVEVIHKHGCPTFMQMNHDGPWQVHWAHEPNPLYAGPPVAASDVYIKTPFDHHNEKPRSLTVPEIQEIVGKFADAAVRARKAGFEGVDVNMASSHLFHSFFSPYWNKRKDEYGVDSIENRARIGTQVVEEIRKRLGPDFGVSVVINGIEMGQLVGVKDSECLRPEDGRSIARLLQQAGADAIQVRSHWIGYHVAGFIPDSFFFPEPPVPVEAIPKEYDASRKGAGANILLAAAIRKSVSVPVAVVGRMDPELGEKVLREGMADFIAMTRRLFADPELPKKLSEGRPEDIAPCTGCTFCLGGRGRCRVNALQATPYTSVGKAEKRKKVLVIGGGPAGMESARVAAVRGHDVTLVEKGRKLGGLLPLATMVKGTHPEDLPALIGYLERQVRKLGVKVELGKEADLSVVEKLRPDVVVVAAGGIPTVPEIPGIDGSNVVSGGDLHRKLKFFLRFFGPETLRWLSSFYMPIGKRVVVIGGEIQGCELAEFLTKRGRSVTIVDKAEIEGAGMPHTMKDHLFLWFERKGVTLIGGVKQYVEITNKGLSIIDRDGKKRLLEADTIVPALPLTPNRSLAASLKGKVPEVYEVGDCVAPSVIADAIGTGLGAARTI
jgi:2,4-dienoyl-CoA reductase (NADPH2)